MSQGIENKVVVITGRVAVLGKRRHVISQNEVLSSCWVPEGASASTRLPLSSFPKAAGRSLSRPTSRTGSRSRT